jgi:hypothetical protein
LPLVSAIFVSCLIHIAGRKVFGCRLNSLQRASGVREPGNMDACPKQGDERGWKAHVEAGRHCKPLITEKVCY